MKRVLIVVLLTSIFLNFAVGIFGPLYAAFVVEIGGDLVTTGASFAMFTISSGVLMYFISRWEDHVKHKEKLVIFGRFVAMVAFFGYLLISKPIHLYFVQGLLGVSFAIGTPAILSLYAKHLEKGKFASEWGVWQALISIIGGVAAISGGIIAESYGFNILFWIMFVFGVLAFVSSFWLLGKRLEECL